VGFEFKYFLNPTKSIHWNPDTSQNGHLMITGGSGAGKTRLAKELMTYLHNRGKNIHVIDVQNTLGVADVPERLFNFEVRNSPYSINPFEFLMDKNNGGPKAQIDDIVEMFRKTFMKRMGPTQSAVLNRLISDTYHKMGILDDDTDTWGFDLSKKELNERLPIIADMKELVDYILDYVSGGYGAKFSSIISSNGRKLNQWHSDMTRLGEELKKLEEVASRDETLANKERGRITSEINDLREKVGKKFGDLSGYFQEYLNYSFLGGEIPTYESLLEEDEQGYGWLDYKFYADKDRLKTIKTIETYLVALNNAGVFGRSTPNPSFSEINRYNLKSLKEESRLFCADIIASKIFRLVYLRGEYKSLPLGESVYKTRRNGTTTDTVIVIDEMQTLLPDTAAEARNKNLLYNRMISQIRNFGGMMMVMSQTPDNFPELFHTNIATKIILNTSASDIPKVRAVTGIKDVNLFKQLENRNKDGNFDVGLMKDRVGNWVAVRMPWFDE
jgi:hypothetical protein